MDLFLKKSFIVDFDLISLKYPLICNFVQLFQPIPVALDALFEGILLNLANDRVHVFLNILFHHPDLLICFCKLRSFPLVEDGLAEGLKLCSSCLSFTPDHLLDSIVEVIKVKR